MTRFSDKFTPSLRFLKEEGDDIRAARGFCVCGDGDFTICMVTKDKGKHSLWLECVGCHRFYRVTDYQ